MFALLSKELPAYSALNYHCMKDGRSAWRVIGNVHDNPELI
ncbi:partial probable prophage Lp2 protein 26 [Prevotella intermedia]|uniref:Partial probable prophage Lp2 protein 26 n=2 Tax=Prevotella intermedia TaxID=28131 RepID=A0A0T7AP90_PREIN|nr:partial probable prophage Lp2 protein 26 [Prevotella intermedia]